MKSKVKLLFVIIFSIVTLLLACEEEKLNLADGTYKGTFTVTYSSGTQTGQTTLEIKNGVFTCTGNSSRIPAGGSGAFSVNKRTIAFSDKNFWTADFDWNLILNGDYNYTFNGSKLKLTKSSNGGTGYYEYDLEKQF